VEPEEDELELELSDSVESVFGVFAMELLVNIEELSRANNDPVGEYHHLLR
jgi:hypothetical protein